MKIILVTGGAGFIGSNFVKYFLRRNKNFIIVNLDKLTYAGSLNNLREIEDNPRHHFIKGDICNRDLVNYILKRYRPDYIINFAAESHVDRGIEFPSLFMETNVMGTLTLLEGAKYIWNKRLNAANRFIQISTDEVYGSIENNSDFFYEESPLLPNSPYSASKASADMIVRSFSKTYGFPAMITRCCNNYGPYQNIEKFIPKCITNAINDKSVPIYGDGSNVREWIHVLDHSIALIRVLFYGKPGEIYNIGTGNEYTNMDITRKIIKHLGKSEDLITMVKDRPGHDKRYALNSYKIRNNISWSSKINFDEGLKDTIRWYLDNEDWWKNK
ncbi:MAG: dTDP-glucose 4,6-dehydratase [Clostridiales bacterium]|jgi:dTDP-glucose 4,6-dehydratase|nr:dTDP-glucose 4,6-dehydratase [Clostridiales bacterium]